jgi:hypothetical protein
MTLIKNLKKKNVGETKKVEKLKKSVKQRDSPGKLKYLNSPVAWTVTMMMRSIYKQKILMKKNLKRESENRIISYYTPCLRYSIKSTKTTVDEDDVEPDSDILKELERKKKEREEEERRNREEEEEWERKKAAK